MNGPEPLADVPTLVETAPAPTDDVGALRDDVRTFDDMVDEVARPCEEIHAQSLADPNSTVRQLCRHHFGKRGPE